MPEPTNRQRLLMKDNDPAPKISADAKDERLISDINAAFERIWRRLKQIEARVAGASVSQQSRIQR
jgi:hypothetical protein